MLNKMTLDELDKAYEKGRIRDEEIPLQTYLEKNLERMLYLSAELRSDPKPEQASIIRELDSYLNELSDINPRPMKTIKEWLSELPEPERSQSLKNLKNQKNKEADSMPDAILSAFVWSETEQGRKYWERIRNKYMI